MDENQLTAKKVSSKIGIILFLMLIVTYVVQVIASYLIMMIIPNAVKQPWYVWSMTVISLYLAAFPIYLKTMKEIPDYEISSEKKYSVAEMIMLVFICLAATYLFNIVSVGLNMLIGHLKGSAVVNPLEVAVTSSNIIYTIIVACVMAPIVEEIIFRKVMINKLVGYGEKLAIIVSSFAFALFHGNLYQLLYAFVLGAIFAYITIKSGTIKYAVILHIIINLLGSVIIPHFIMSSNKVVVGATTIILFISILAGIMLFIRKRKELFPSLKELPEIEGQEKTKVSTVLLSEGMVVFWVASIILILVTIFVS